GCRSLSASLRSSRIPYPSTTTVLKMITVLSMTMILLLVLSLVSSFAMCFKERKMKREYKKKEKMMKDKEKEDEMKKEAERKKDEIEVSKWEADYKSATGRDVNDEMLIDIPYVEDECYDDALMPKEFVLTCPPCKKPYNPEHDRGCVDFRKWRMERLKFQREMEERIKEEEFKQKATAS
ncbi:hypothetical protein PFISCL1PPCAC_25877, partial [Pristionchus fissidentatus]